MALTNVLDATNQASLDALGTSSIEAVQNFIFTIGTYAVDFVTTNLLTFVTIALIGWVLSLGVRAIKGRASGGISRMR